MAGLTDEAKRRLREKTRAELERANSLKDVGIGSTNSNDGPHSSDINADPPPPTAKSTEEDARRRRSRSASRSRSPRRGRRPSSHSRSRSRSSRSRSPLRSRRRSVGGKNSRSRSPRGRRRRNGSGSPRRRSNSPRRNSGGITRKGRGFEKDYRRDGYFRYDAVPGPPRELREREMREREMREREMREREMREREMREREMRMRGGMPIGGGPRGPPPPGFFGGGPPPGPPADPMMRAYGPASGFRAGDEFGRARAGRGERDGRERDYERARERDYERERERARERIRREEREREHGEERRRDRGRSRSEVERERDREGRREEGRGRTRSHSEERPTEDARVRNRSFSHERPQDETRGRNRTRSSSFERSKDENRGRRSMSKDSVKDDNKKKERIQSADRVLEEKKDGHPTEDLDRNEEDRSSLSRRRRSRSEDRSERRGEKRRKSEENGKRRDRAENGDGPDHGGNDHTSDDDKKPSSPRDKSPQQSDSKPKRERRRRESPPPMTREEREAAALTKDRRTVFVSQLVLRATEKDVRRYFRRNVGKVNDVILLKDRRTGRHKGIAYVELGRLEDVSAAVALSNQVPDFQRFPLLVRESEAEKNHAGRVVVPGTEEAAVAALVAIPGVPGTVGRLPSGVVVSSAHLDVQKVYVGSIERAVTPAQLSLIFNQFGTLTNVNLQVDPATGVSRGFAFLSYTCPKVANLAIQTMSGQILAGRALKTGWANQMPANGIEPVMSTEFPESAQELIQKVNVVMIQLTGVGLSGIVLDPNTAQPLLNASAPVSSVANAQLNAALGYADTMTANPTQNLTVSIGGVPSSNLLIKNMFDKDTETDEGWEEELHEEVQEECSNYGIVMSVKVVHDQPMGLVYVKFQNETGATTCANALSGRWFDQRQLVVEYVPDSEVPP